METNDTRNALLARVASLFYDQNRSLQEIADITGINRSIVSRMLIEAREHAVVEIKVHYPWTSTQLERDLISKFGLKSARVMVLENQTYPELLAGLGTLMAQYVEGLLHDNMLIGISWGSPIPYMIDALKPRKMTGVEIIQLIGASGLESNLSDGPLLAQRLSGRLGASSRYMNVPLVVENKSMRDALFNEENIKETINLASQAEIAITGIGVIDPELYSFKSAGYVSEKERAAIEKAGIVGDFCGHHFTIDGKFLDLEINNRVISINPDLLAKIDTIIASAGGNQKHKAILGALRGNFVNVLITDDETARFVLENA